MKKYNLFELFVVKTLVNDEYNYFICRYNEITDCCVELFTNKIIKKSSICKKDKLINYYLPSELVKYDSDVGKVMIDKYDLLVKYADINNEFKLSDGEEIESNNKINFNSILDDATLNFFPKNGIWLTHCYDKPSDLRMSNLPCNLRNYEWLAKMLKKSQNLYFISNKKVLNYVVNSDFFEEKRSEYEQEIIKNQIKWSLYALILTWKYTNVASEYKSVDCDEDLRNSVKDTLLRIGISEESIEKGLEANSDLWLDTSMNLIFSILYDPYKFDNYVYSLYNNSDKPIMLPPDEEFRVKWIEMRKYDYYQNHRRSINKYGNPEECMLVSRKHARELREYINVMHEKRINELEDFVIKRNNYVKILNK